MDDEYVAERVGASPNGVSWYLEGFANRPGWVFMALNVDRVAILQSLLDSVGDEAALARSVEQIGAPLAAIAAHALVVDRAGGMVVDAVSYARIDAEPRFEDYEAHWRDRDPRYLLAARRQDEVHSDLAVVDPVEFERSGVYNEHLLRTGIRYTLFGNFGISPELQLGIAFMRPRAKGGFQGEEVELLSSLIAPLSQTFRMHQLVRRLELENRDLREALDRMPCAVAILGRGGRVTCANAPASVLLSRGDGVGTRRGVLTAAHPDDARRLAAAFCAAEAVAQRRARVAEPSSTANLRIRRQHGAPLDVVLFPLTPRSALEPPGHVMAVFYDPDREVSLDVDLVARQYGLTATEAEVAVALATGASPTNIAAARGCSEETVRTHLKRVFSKTGFARQPDLVRALLTGPAVHRAR